MVVGSTMEMGWKLRIVLGATTEVGTKISLTSILCLLCLWRNRYNFKGITLLHLALSILHHPGVASTTSLTTTAVLSAIL